MQDNCYIAFREALNVLYVWMDWVLLGALCALDIVRLEDSTSSLPLII